MRWMMGTTVAAALAACAPAAPPADEPDVPPAQPQGEFQPSHHAVVQGVVTGRQGQPLDSVTVVAWRLARGAMVVQTRAVTDAQGRFTLPLLGTVGPLPTPVPERAVLRGFAYASRYPRGPQGSVALDSTIVDVTLVPVAQAAPVVHARITLPLP
jgi:hypothetical protein